MSTSVLITTLVFTILHWLFLVLDASPLERLPHWYWQKSLTPLPMWWLLLPLAALAVIIVRRVLKHPEHAVTNVLLLILLGYTVQFSFGNMPGLGMYGLTCRMTQTDHAAFARTAARRTDMSYVLRNYYELIKAGELSPHPHSTKPPGQLMFYMLTERLARLLPGNRPPLDRITLLAALIYPLLTYLVLIPLYFLSRLLLPREHAAIPLVLYVFVPNVALMTLHLDQALYPLLFMVPLCLFLYSVEKRSIYLAFPGGLTAYAAMFVSFSLVPLLALPFIYTVLIPRRECEPGGRSCAEPSAPGRRRLLPGPALYLLGFACGYAFLRLTLGYSAIEGYTLAMARHQGAKITSWTCGTIAYIGLLDILEFAVWTGIPLFVLFAANQVRALRRLRRKELNTAGAVSLSLLAIVLLMAFAGRTVAETGRLWLFVVPLLCLSAANALLPREACPAVTQSVYCGGRGAGKAAHFTVGLVATLQLITILLTKAFHDFY